MWLLYHEYGASARMLAGFVLEDTLPIPRSCHLAVFMEPSPTFRSSPKKRVASCRLAEMLRDKRSKTGFPDNWGGQMLEIDPILSPDLEQILLVDGRGKPAPNLTDEKTKAVITRFWLHWL